MLHVLMEHPRLDLPLLLHRLPPGLDLRLATHLRLLVRYLLLNRLPLELLGLPLELLLGRHGLLRELLGLPLKLLWLSLELLGLALELLRLPLELLGLALKLLGLPLELLGLSGRGRVSHLRLPLVVLGVDARRGSLLGEYHSSRERDEREQMQQAGERLHGERQDGVKSEMIQRWDCYNIKAFYEPRSKKEIRISTIDLNVRQFQLHYCAP